MGKKKIIEFFKIIKMKWLFLIFASLFAGLFSVKYAPNGPFSEVSKYPILDVLKVAIIITIIAYLLFLVSSRISKKMVHIIFIAMVLRIITVFIMSFYGLLPDQYDNNWDVAALQLLPDWHSGNFHFETGIAIGNYSKLTTIFYYFIGFNPIYMQLFNVLFACLTIYYIFKITNHLFNKRIAYSSSLLMAVWPTHIFFSSMHMKEALAIFFIVGLVYYFLKWIRFYQFTQIFMVGFFFLMNILIRPQNAVLLLIILFPCIVYVLWINSAKYLKVIVIMMATLSILIVVAFLYTSGYMKYFDFNYIESEMSYRTDGGSSYLEWMQYGSIIDVLIYSPIRLVYFIYTPFLWQISSFPQAIAFVESSILIIMTGYILKGFKTFWRNYYYKSEIIILIAFCIVGLTANGIIDSNVGTSMRHKLQYIFIYPILFAAIKSNIYNIQFNKNEVSLEKNKILS